MTDYDLTPEDLGNAERAARRFQATWWQGTSGTLAAWVILLLKERKRMTTTMDKLAADNAALREAVEARLAESPEPECVRAMPPDAMEAAWAAVKRRHAETVANVQRFARDPAEANTADPPDGLRPGSREFLAVLNELRALHLAKTLDYGVDEDALANIRSSADVVNMPPWAGCILRISDKMHRLKAFFRRGRTEFDGVEDTLKDIACYSAIALVLYREANCTKVQ